MPLFLLAAILAAMCPAVTYGAGLATGDNFSVIVPAKPSQEEGDKYAKLVLRRAEAFRAHFAKEWFGEELPMGDVRTVISVRFSTTENSGMTIAKERPDHKFHNVFLASTAENAADGLLHHEIAHTVLATRYPHPNRLPTWVEEGIASRYDSAWLTAIRQQEVRSWVRAGRFPSIADLCDAASIKSFDDTGYAASESLVAYLLTLGDKRTLLCFADEGQRSGWDAAARKHYNFTSLGRLQHEWNNWLIASQR